MILRMFSKQTQHIQKAHSATPQMVPRSRIRLGWQILEQLVIVGSKLAHGIKRLRWFPFRIIGSFRPRILIPGNQRRIVFRDDLSKPYDVGGLGIGEMSHNLADAPLIRRDFKIEFRTCGASNRHSDKFRATPESFQQLWYLVHKNCNSL